MSSKFDQVDKPPHYNWLPNGIETKDVTVHFSCMTGSAIKYIWRAGKKQHQDKTLEESAIIDIQKARRCLEYEIERLRNCGKLSKKEATKDHSSALRNAETRLPGHI